MSVKIVTVILLLSLAPIVQCYEDDDSDVWPDDEDLDDDVDEDAAANGDKQYPFLKLLLQQFKETKGNDGTGDVDTAAAKEKLDDALKDLAIEEILGNGLDKEEEDLKGVLLPLFEWANRASKDAKESSAVADSAKFFKTSGGPDICFCLQQQKPVRCPCQQQQQQQEQQQQRLATKGLANHPGPIIMQFFMSRN